MPRGAARSVRSEKAWQPRHTIERNPLGECDLNPFRRFGTTIRILTIKESTEEVVHVGDDCGIAVTLHSTRNGGADVQEVENWMELLRRASNEALTHTKLQYFVGVLCAYLEGLGDGTALRPIIGW
jgi:hypothetical protein